MLTALAWTLDCELLALVRGESAECPVCGGQVVRLDEGSLSCPQCGASLRSLPESQSTLQLPMQAG